MQINQQLLNKISSAQNAVILSHRSPDGDSIGSSLAIWQFLNKLGVSAVPISPDPAPDFLSWLGNYDQLINFEQHQDKAEELIDQADLIFCLDFNSPKRLANMEACLTNNKAAFKINIDHHQEPEDFCDLQYIDTTASSTAELIYRFVEELEWEDKIDLPMAEAIYTGILTDTGSFRFSSTSQITHEIAASLIALGVEPHIIHARVYDSYSAERLKLLGYSLNEGLKLYKDQQIAIISLDAEVLKRFHFKRGDTEGLVNYPLSIKSVKIAILLTENDGKVKMSFRSKGDLAVNTFAAEYFSGGGHINAAGGISDQSMKETLIKLESHLSELL